MILLPREWKCVVGRRTPGKPCPKNRWMIPGVVTTLTCFKHMPADTRTVLRAMGEEP